MQNKFKFTTEYQFDLLRYITIDKNGINALNKVNDSFFTLTEHSVIAYCLIKYLEKNGRIPGETILRENIRQTLNTKQFVDLVTKDEQKNIMDLVKPLYKGTIKDGDDIYNGCKKFSAFVKLKNVIEDIDLNDFDSYNKFSKDISLAIEDEDDINESSTSLLFGDIKERQFRRQEHKTIIPTPFKQINRLTNAGGHEKGSVMVILDKEKKGKTAVLINITRGYIKQKKNVLYIDLENGKDAILSRLEQSINRLNKVQILNGEFDKRIQKKARKFIRVGGEVVVERLPALTTTADTIQHIIDKYYKLYGIRFEMLIIDYLGKMGSISKKVDDFGRISDAYMDIANLCDKNDIEHCWTANHVTREGAKMRMKTRYESTDIAKCIDIVRHVHAIYGINRTPEEEEAGFLRMELVEQRDGRPNGRAVFNINMDTQRIDELSIAARKIYDVEYAPHIFNNNRSEIKSVSKEKIKQTGDL